MHNETARTRVNALREQIPRAEPAGKNDVKRAAFSDAFCELFQLVTGFFGPPEFATFSRKTSVQPFNRACPHPRYKRAVILRQCESLAEIPSLCSMRLGKLRSPISIKKIVGNACPFRKLGANNE